KLYEWVSSHIRYVNIVLGAGGFLPHQAADVLKNGYGDCKDHVMLLQALLSAKGIKSSPVLIRAGESLYKLPSAASPFVFDHLITYIPEFQLFTDSTARYAPFGILPGSDAGKEVLIVSTGKVAPTPAIAAANTSITATSTLTVNADGSADTETKFITTGALSVDMRALMAALPPDRDGDFFRAALGPGSDGKFQRGQPETLGDSYEFTARYHAAHLANLPGPGALPAALAYKPFSFSQLVGLSMPESRQADYACASGTYREDITATLPASTSVAALPPAKSIATDGAMLQTSYENPSPNIVKHHVLLKLDRTPVCRAADYARIKPSLSAMVSALFAQTLYK
ncbi:MAG: transglutaminase domain-containing protein, partial [Burkholderia sp.]|nr:transglutaminase domain-containing protein [Burkholderia sp.]